MFRFRASGRRSYNSEPLVYICPLARNVPSSHRLSHNVTAVSSELFQHVPITFGRYLAVVAERMRVFVLEFSLEISIVIAHEHSLVFALDFSLEFSLVFTLEISLLCAL